MRQTNIRFGRDLWALLQDEAAFVGVSVSQYIREAALARATAAAVARGQEPFARLARADARSADESSDRPVKAAAGNLRSEARALRGESQQAQSMARRALSRNEELRQQQTPPERSS